METLYDVAIVGAGASGLICALECARGGKKTILLEKDTLPARKILVSGNGRCNLTNRHVSPACYHADPKLIESALSHFSFEDCWKYFENLGVLLTEQEQGRVFPATGKATAVADALKVALKEAGAELSTGQEVTHIKHAKPNFILTTKQGLNVHAKNVVLACGSCAYPQVTGTNSGYDLAKMLGHTLIPPLPVLSGLCLKETALARLSGIKCQARTTACTTPPEQAEGELIFTNYGINGPAALNISQAVSRALAKGPVPVEINFFPQLQNPLDFLKARLNTLGQRKPKDFFAGILHESIANLLIDFVGLHKQIPVQQQPMQRAFQTLVAWPVTVTAMRPWKEAMVAAGGVKTREINYNTFESLVCPGVFITGELLDVDGKSGGLNLHFAWASGFTAAQALKGK
ncbi:MAG: aminoacetone oxidase family FAD-binding enzyme [Elusimicrobiaceae bacterium]|nr:aminoacetone oxidase family FAD-binding enzyme [Elusimicrobiaceae bacterium]